MRKLKQLFTWGFFFLAIFSVSAQNVQLSGTVKDEAGTPLLGVFIMIKGLSEEPLPTPTVSTPSMPA